MDRSARDRYWESKLLWTCHLVDSFHASRGTDARSTFYTIITAIRDENIFIPFIFLSLCLRAVKFRKMTPNSPAVAKRVFNFTFNIAGMECLPRIIIFQTWYETFFVILILRTMKLWNDCVSRNSSHVSDTFFFYLARALYLLRLTVQQRINILSSNVSVSEMTENTTKL